MAAREGAADNRAALPSVSDLPLPRRPAQMPPMKTVQPSRYVLFLLIAIGGCAGDLLTKSWIFDRLKMPHRQPTEWLWQGVFGFTTSLNEGALFGIGQGQV